MRQLTAALVTSLAIALCSSTATAFCGFYVAKADTKLFNRASQVVLVRHDGKTVITMANDYKGEPKEFAIVVPVPTVLEQGQIHVGDRAVIEHLDAYSSPRLVEYHDANPCAAVEATSGLVMQRSARLPLAAARETARSLGVAIEASYTVGEYDILILSARESTGLATWLRDNGYRLPDGADAVLGSYLKQGMRFFVAKVNLAEQAKLGFSYLRPLQIAFASPKFTLPIRLGTLNADGTQELYVYALTRKGRVETINYRTVRLPSDVEIPVHVKEEFPQFYRAMFSQQVNNENRHAVFLEYAWDMNWCDPCAANPLSTEELRQLGVFWMSAAPAATPNPSLPFPRMMPGAVDVFLTRLHVRYDGAHFPDDLAFQETGDRQNFQGRYIIRHPWRGEDTCPAAATYRKELDARAESQATTLAALTGWPVDDIRKKMGPLYGAVKADDRPWWKKLWSE